MTSLLLSMPPMHHATPAVALPPAKCSHPPDPRPASEPSHAQLIRFSRHIGGSQESDQVELLACWVHVSCWKVDVVVCVCPEPGSLSLSLSTVPQRANWFRQCEDRQTNRHRLSQTMREDRHLAAPQPTPSLILHSPPPCFLPPAYGNKLSLSQSMQGRGLGLYLLRLSDLPPFLTKSFPVLSNWPVATPCHWWRLGAEPRQVKPEQNELCAIQIFKINVMDIFSEENVSFACLSCMYISFIYRWGLYLPTKGTRLSQMSMLSIRMTVWRICTSGCGSNDVDPKEDFHNVQKDMNTLTGSFSI